MNKLLLVLLTALTSLCMSLPAYAGTRTITDMAGRTVEIPDKVDKVICSGPGCLRYLTYLQGQGLIVGVDSIEKRKSRFDSRPYAMANPQFKDKPLFGEFRGHDNPELILSLEPQPQVIFKTYKGMGFDPDKLQEKTGIPVICLAYSSIATKRQLIYNSLKLMGDVVGKSERAEKICNFIEKNINDLEKRTADVPESQRKSCYVGGIAKKGPHGFQSTEPAYPPFLFVNAKNVACPPEEQGKPLQHANVSKEQIVAWNPEILFMDISTCQLGDEASAINELKTDPVYKSLDAVINDQVYTVLPYNWYSRNYGSIIADAFYVGKVLYPEKFADIDPKVKADEIYSFMVGKPVFNEMDNAFKEKAFDKLVLR
ncbi:iron ABC transporter substrate-binding protein [Maridesulfovibrio ferrireducens]|uniref:iron ABC transporter substrate-binding protein n=1 Tax=Maridesulfovibrio ferrireducens TaxID=246191 RepID=UPI001A28A3DE|nr:iron ABC transporter substrate-binding protein [Maridesulfovibrio ferrireducens]MBI9111284.1 iron ABC transporter substrate-binding protein [Maridesulfovibrio ferrireducens]